MVLHLVSNPQSPFYQSGNFMKVIKFAQDNQRRARLKETADRLSLSVDRVVSISQAIGIIGELAG